MTRARLFVRTAFGLGLCHAPALFAQSVPICTTWGTLNIPNDTAKEYVVQNNFWNSAAAGGTQCITVNPANGAFTITTAPGSVPTNGAPASYPSIFKGCHWGDCTNNSGLPLQLSNLGTANAHWAIAPTSAGMWDAALDIWFHQSATTIGQPNGAEVMIWLNHLGPPQPFGGLVASNVSINGTTWNVWFGRSSWNIISYVRVTPGVELGTASAPMDLKPFFADASGRGYIASSWWLLDVEAGFEPWQNSLNLASTAFTATFAAGSNTGNQTLNVARAGAGSGTVTSAPAGINCGSSCSASFANGASVVLSATPASGSTFAGWSGACTGTGSCTVSMTQARAVTATFNAPASGCTVTATPLVLQNQPWYIEEGVRIDHTGTLTALNVAIVLARTSGVNSAGQYNTFGVLQNTNSTSSAITYSFNLAASQTIAPGTNRRAVGQASGNGTAHPTSGDTYTLSATCDGTPVTVSGTFP